ncbi:hypothetical protein NE236_06675 [Actinoallomurus purpureus]|uniref:hypothetical protein n=1 Tax=Actinoallomurus purpureus TaxID=478114 RepID=UPI002093B553|nr:hypothetical protein [Actinoallomurus purpureus]MCO6004660.1 hypothetical protein [Actinoallomurus purpureus]
MRYKSLASAAAITGILLAGGATSAAAVTPNHPASGTASVACEFPRKTVKAHESVKIRKTAHVKSTYLGLLPKGKRAKRVHPCAIVTIAGNYSLCGWKNDNRWDLINYRGIKGWVPLACVVG